MAEPISLGLSIFALAEATIKTTSLVIDFVKRCRAAEADLEALKYELFKLGNVVEDINKSQPTLNDNHAGQIEPAISMTKMNIAEIQSFLQEQEVGGRFKQAIKWGVVGKKKVDTMKESLERNREHLYWTFQRSVGIETFSTVQTIDATTTTTIDKIAEMSDKMDSLPLLIAALGAGTGRDRPSPPSDAESIAEIRQAQTDAVVVSRGVRVVEEEPMLRLPRTQVKARHYRAWGSLHDQDDRCWRCGTKGHWVEDCWVSEKRVEAIRDFRWENDRCCYCGLKGHWARDCFQQDLIEDADDRVRSRPRRR